MKTGSRDGTRADTRTRSGGVRRRAQAIAASLVIVLTLLVPSQPADALSDFDAELIELLNDWRAGLGLNRLAIYSPLSEQSEQWSQYMASGSAACTSAGSRFEHSELSLNHPANPPETVSIAENLAYACGTPGFEGDITWSRAAGALPSYCTSPMDYTTPEVTVCGWLSSTTHRPAIANPTNTHFGSGTVSLSLANGAVERFSTQLFTRSALPQYDASCDGDFDITDALVIAQFSAQVRQNVGSCAMTDPRTQVNANKGDVDGNGSTNIVDALLVARCVVRIANCD